DGRPPGAPCWGIVAIDEDAEARQLYRVPLDEFVRPRNDRAKELTKAADREGGAAVRALRKPTVAAWALDRLADEQPAVVDAVVDAASRVIDAQQQALSGNAGAMRVAT